MATSCLALIFLFNLYFRIFGPVVQPVKDLKKDTSYVIRMNDIAFQKVQEGDYDEVFRLIGEMESVSIHLNYGFGLYKVANMRGIVEYSRQNSEKAMAYFLECNEIIKKYKLPDAILQNSLNNIGIIYDQIGDRENATRYAVELIYFQEKKNLNPMKTWPYDQLGKNLKFQKKYREALSYFEKGLKIETTAGNLSGMAIAENNLGNLYDDLAQTDEAIKHFTTGLKYAEKISYKLLQTDLLTNLGSMYRKKGEISKAEFYLRKSEKICRQMDVPISLKTVCHNLGDLYFSQKKFFLAEKYYREAVELSGKIHDQESIYTANQALAELYEQTGDFQEAYRFKTAAETAKDSVFKIETARATEEMLRKYEADKREQEIALLNARNEKSSLLNKALAGGTLAILLIGGISIGYANNRNKLRRLQESQKLRNKIAGDLHDEIGSTLSSILLLSEMAQKTGVNPMFAKINADSRAIMESMDEIVWTINPVNDNLEGILLKIKEFAIPLTASRNIDFQVFNNTNTENLSLSPELRRNIYLIIKEAVNNLAKYSGAKKAALTLELERDALTVKIEDNGGGFDTGVNSGRNGLRNMRTRAEEVKGRLEMHSSTHGTCIFLSVPVA